MTFDILYAYTINDKQILIFSQKYEEYFESEFFITVLTKLLVKISLKAQIG